MKNVSIMVFEVAIVAVMMLAGLSGKKILFIQGGRSYTILLGIFGLLFCTMSVGKFISLAPFHPLTILGYFFGIVALIVFATQLFNWKVPFLIHPNIALTVLCLAMIINSIIARFEYLLK